MMAKKGMTEGREERLKKLLQDCLDVEDYEQAAKVRDALGMGDFLEEAASKMKESMFERLKKDAFKERSEGTDGLLSQFEDPRIERDGTPFCRDESEGDERFEGLVKMILGRLGVDDGSRYTRGFVVKTKKGWTWLREYLLYGEKVLWMRGNDGRDFWMK